MTIGEKIKYCRKNRLGLSQAQLAQKTGINITTIKLYESNKMIPSQSQAQKLADIFGVDIEVFTEPISNWMFKLETYGDLTKLIMISRKNQIIFINGTRMEDGKLDANTVTFSVSSQIGKSFQSTKCDCSADEINFSIKNKAVLDNILKWESLYTKYEDLSEKYKNDENANSILKVIQDNLDLIELEMQFNSLLLERIDGRIAVKVNPDYGNEEILIQNREKAIAKVLKSQKSQAKKSRQKKDDNK